MRSWIDTIRRRLLGQEDQPLTKPNAPRAGSDAGGTALPPASARNSVPTNARSSSTPATFDNVAQLNPTTYKLFDPALRHFASGVRAGVPAFENQGQKQQWQAAREMVMDHVLQCVAQSAYRDDLVLRGSMLMKKWYGAEARVPGDIDWVFWPASIAMKNEFATSCIEFVANVIRQISVGPVRVLADTLAMDEIWSYERAPGCRLSIPWLAEALPLGHVQTDIVFGEHQAIEPVLTSIGIFSGSEIELLAVTREQALASKLLWLRTDMSPQGKDFYDAFLLSRDALLTLEQLSQTFQLARKKLPRETPSEWILNRPVAWNHFETEYPELAGRHKQWEVELKEALKRVN